MSDLTDWLSNMPEDAEVRLRKAADEIEHLRKICDAAWKVIQDERKRIAELEIKNAKLSNYLHRVEDAVRSYQANKQETE